MYVQPGCTVSNQTMDVPGAVDTKMYYKVRAYQVPNLSKPSNKKILVLLTLAIHDSLGGGPADPIQHKATALL